MSDPAPDPPSNPERLGDTPGAAHVEEAAVEPRINGAESLNAEARQDLRRGAGEGVGSYIWRVFQRILRWVFWAVMLALVPVILSWLFLPPDEGLSNAVERGELTALALALAAGALDILAGSEIRRGWRNFLQCISIATIVATIMVLAGLFGKAPHLAANEAELAGDWCLALAILVGAVAVGSDVRRRTG